MRLLTRYVLFELLKVFLVALTGITLFMLLVGVGREAYQQGLGFKQVLLLLPYILPDALRFAVPGTILFAACSIYGRMSSSNEVVAVKAQGISPMALIWPTLAFAFLVSLAAVWLNDVASSWGRDGARRVVIESVVDVIYGKLEQQHSYGTKQFSINVKEVEGRKLLQATFSFSGGDDSPPVTISCQDAELRSDLAAGTLTIVCHNGTFDAGDVRFTFPDKLERVIPLDEASKKGGGRSPADIALRQIPIEVRSQQDRNELTEQQLALSADQQMLSGDFAGLTSTQWAADLHRLDDDRSRLFRLQMEPARRWANGFSCLCFVLIGAPMAILMRSADFLTSFFACFLPILVIYYPLLILGVDQAKLGTLPAWSVWTGNVILVLCGTWLMRRVIRY